MKVTINDKIVAVPATLGEVRLLDFIRDFVGLKGTKFGCGMGLCGACTVHIDGAAARSCQILVEDVVGLKVTTIEGLAGPAIAGSIAGSEETLHPVQKAWMKEAVPQCGYCQAGQIMTAAAFLSRNPDPSDKEIRAEMSGNLCRCGTYPRIRRAIVRAAKES